MRNRVFAFQLALRRRIPLQNADCYVPPAHSCNAQPVNAVVHVREVFIVFGHGEVGQIIGLVDPVADSFLCRDVNGV